MKTIMHGLGVIGAVIGGVLVIIGGFIMTILPYVLSVGVLGAIIYVLIKAGEAL